MVNGMNSFEIINETEENIKELKEVKKLVEFALNYQQIENSIFNIIIVDEEKIQEINREYRNIDRPTDVITFALEDYEDIKLEHRMLGDIYISLDKARSQAEEYGHSFKREICFLAVHGFLHLLGYDHMTKEDEEEMFLLQELILNEANIKK